MKKNIFLILLSFINITLIYLIFDVYKRIYQIEERESIYQKSLWRCLESTKSEYVNNYIKSDSLSENYDSLNSSGDLVFWSNQIDSIVNLQSKLKR